MCLLMIVVMVLVFLGCVSNVVMDYNFLVVFGNYVIWVFVQDVGSDFFVFLDGSWI